MVVPQELLPVLLLATLLALSPTASGVTVSWPSHQPDGEDLTSPGALAAVEDTSLDSTGLRAADGTLPHGSVKKRSIPESDEDAASEKRSIGSLARQDNFWSFSSHPKRSLSSVARTSASRWYSKRSLASLARGEPGVGLVSDELEGPLPGRWFDMQKRHIGAFARLAASGFRGPKRTLASLVTRRNTLDGGRREYKRGLSSIARQGGYGERHRADKRQLSSIVRQGGFRAYDKRSLASLVRQSGLTGNDQEESELSSLDDKRSLSSIAQHGNVFGWDGPEKRGLSSIARQGGFGSDYPDRRSLGSLASQELYGDHSRRKQNIASIAPLGNGFSTDDLEEEFMSPADLQQLIIDDGYGKRGLSSLARQGNVWSSNSEAKRGLSSIARQGGINNSGEKRSLASVARQGGFNDGITVRPRPTRFPQYLDNLDELPDDLGRSSWLRLAPVLRGDWEDDDDDRQKRYMAALAHLAPRPLVPSSYWVDQQPVSRPRATRSSGADGDDPTDPGDLPDSDPAPAAAEPERRPEEGAASRRDDTGSPEEPQARRKRSATRQLSDISQQPSEDGVAQHDSAEAAPAAKRHLASLVRGYALTAGGQRNGWRSRYGRSGGRAEHSSADPRAY